MNDKISLQRIKLLLRADWIEHRTQVSFVIGSFLAAFIFFFLITLQGDATTKEFIRKQYFFYGLGLFGSFIYYCRYIGAKVHEPKGLFLTLPANTMEKFSAFLLEGFILIAVFHLLLWPALYVISLTVPGYSVISFFDIMRTFKISLPIIAFLSSLVFLSYITFRKHAFPAVILAYTLLLGGTIFMIKKFVIEALGSQQGVFTEMTPMYYTVNFLVRYHVIAFVAATLGILYIAYLKLKEKELR